MKKAVQFGAGNIGRGFLAQLFNSAGYEVVFVDVDKQLISLLNRHRAYRLDIVGDKSDSIPINNVRGVDARDTEQVARKIASADIVATAVGVKILPAIAPVIGNGIERRKDAKREQPLNIIICENLLNAGEIFKGYVRDRIGTAYIDYLNQYIGFVEAVVSRMIPVMSDEDKEKDPLLIRAEEYGILPVNKNGFKGKIPRIKGMAPHDNFNALVEQKLFIHNLGHAIFAYLGYLSGHQFIWEAVEDKKINEIAAGALQESGAALNKKHGFTEAEQQQHIEDLIKRFSNQALGDTIFRVGRDPLRKLGPNDRFIGSARLALEYEISPEHIATGIAAALRYDYAKDAEAVKLSEHLAKQDIDWVLENICGLKSNERLAKMIKEKIK